MTAPLDERAAPLLLPNYVAPAVDLLTRALVPHAQLPTAIAGPWSALCLAAFEERHPTGRYLLLENMPPPSLKPVVTSWPRVYGRALPCPVKPQSLGGFVQSLALWDASTDATALRECVRSLRPGGYFAGAFLVRGSFDGFFDAAREVCEAEGFADVAAALVEAENQFRHPDPLRTLASRAGLVDVELGLEERGIPFASAREFLTDAAVGAVLMRHVALDDESMRARLLAAVEQTLDTYLAGMGLHARVVTGVLRGLKPVD